MTTDATVGIGAAAHALRTTARTLRYYEHLGLLTPDRSSMGGHRRYPPTLLRRARHLLALRDLGLAVPDIRSLLDGHDEAHAQTILRDQAHRIDAEITTLTDLRQRITCRLTDAPAAPDETLDLLEDLAVNFILSRIYTRDGDTGTTELATDVRVAKTDPRLSAMGDVDELVSGLGMAVAAPDARHVDLLRQLQNDLFDVGADLTADEPAHWRVDATYVARLESDCDRLNAEVAPARSFVLPGATQFTAALHHARAICRRAERHSWHLPEASDEVRRYLNRLSDLLFILARASEPTPEPQWRPGTHPLQPPVA